MRGPRVSGSNEVDTQVETRMSVAALLCGMAGAKSASAEMRSKVPLCSPEPQDETPQDDIATIEGDEERIIRPDCLGSMDVLHDRESGEKRVVSPRCLRVFEKE